MTTFHEKGYRNTADEVHDRSPICQRCEHAWPCDTARLILALIDADARCGAPFCGVSNLGHLIEDIDPELVDLIMALDPEAPDGWRER